MHNTRSTLWKNSLISLSVAAKNYIGVVHYKSKFSFLLHFYQVLLLSYASLSSIFCYVISQSVFVVCYFVFAFVNVFEYNCSNLSFVIFFQQLLQFLLCSNSSVYFVMFGGIVKSMLLFGNVQVLLAIMLSMLHNTCI